MEKQIEMVQEATKIMERFYGDSPDRHFRLESIRKIEQSHKYEIGISFIPEDSAQSIYFNPNDLRITKYVRMWESGRFDGLFYEEFKEGE